MLSGDMTKKFKVIYGYGPNDYASIDENDLVKAQVMFMEGKGKAIFEDSSIRGQDILRIVPDWHAHFGWNKGYKMLPEDDEYVQPLEKTYKLMIAGTKDIAKFIVEKKRYELLEAPLIEQKLVLPKREELPTEIRDMTKLLAEQFNARK